MDTNTNRPAPRHTWYGIAIDTLAPGASHKYAAYVAGRWVYGDTLAEVKDAMRRANGMGKRPNGR
jgi:hypothetical protein